MKLGILMDRTLLAHKRAHATHARAPE